MPTTYQPHYQPHINYIPTTYQLHTNHIPTTYQPHQLHTNHISTTYQPHTDCIVTTYQPHQLHVPVPTMCQPHYQPHINYISTYQLHTDHVPHSIPTTYNKTQQQLPSPASHGSYSEHKALICPNPRDSCTRLTHQCFVCIPRFFIGQDDLMHESHKHHPDLRSISLYKNW